MDEGGGLEIRCGGNFTGGSNPSLSGLLGSSYTSRMGYREPVAPEAYRRQNAALAAMSDGAKLAQALKLSEVTRSMLRSALRRAGPGATEEELHRRYLARLQECHKRIS